MRNAHLIRWQSLLLFCLLYSEQSEEENVADNNIEVIKIVFRTHKNRICSRIFLSWNDDKVSFSLDSKYSYVQTP